MKDFDEVLAGLEERPERIRYSVQRTPPPKVAQKASQQRGKRASGDHVQVNGFIRKEYKASLHFYAKQEEVGISDLIGRLLEEYVDKRGGVIGRKFKKS